MTEIPAKGSNVIIKKKENISSTFMVFLESTQNFTHFQRKDQLYSLNISEVIDSEKCGYFNARKLQF